MSRHDDSPHPAPANDDVVAVWDANAVFWDERMGEGNVFHRELVGPATERLLDLRPGERVLEIACGNGQMARRMAELGATVLATDAARRFLEVAQARTAARPEIADRVTYAYLDAADPEALAAIPGAPFDAVVCGMALMDMRDIAPLYAALPRLLGRQGRFVATLMHPAFNSVGTRQCAEEEDVAGEIRLVRSLRIVRYKSLGPSLGLGMIGQPRAQWYFHRTLADLLNPAFAAGLVLDGIDEPAFPGTETNPTRLMSWELYPETPPVLAFRLRVR